MLPPFDDFLESGLKACGDTLKRLSDCCIWKIVLGFEARKLAFVTNQQIALLVLEADGRNGLSELDFSDQLLLVVPYLDKAICVTSHNQPLAVVDVH